MTDQERIIFLEARCDVLESRLDMANRNIQNVNRNILRVAKLVAIVSGIPESVIDDAVREEESRASGGL